MDGLLLGLIAIPIAGGYLAYRVALRRSGARLSVARVLAKDSYGNPIWKVLVRSSANRIVDCKVQIGKDYSIWEGVNVKTIEIGPGGLGIALMPAGFKPDSTITITSGPYTLFSSKFDHLEEVRYSM